MCSQNKHLLQREEYAFGHEETCFHTFSSHCQACQFRVFSMSVHRIFSFFWQGLEHFMTFYEKICSLSLFRFRRRVMFLTKKILANQVFIPYYNTTHCSLVRFLKLFWSLFFKYYHKLKKATGAIQKIYFLRKSHSF